MRLALTHAPSPLMTACQLTYVNREPVDYHSALKQHFQFCSGLAECGLEVVTLAVNLDQPDSVYVEDVAVVLDEAAVITSMGNEKRRLELSGMILEIAKHRPIERIELPARIDGGDVLRVGRTLYVGQSARTDKAGFEALAAIAQRHGYRAVPVPVHGCLHLKTGCTALDDTTLIANPEWIDTKPLGAFKVIPVPPDEPWAANVLRVDETICMSSAFPKTIDLVRNLGFPTRLFDISEFQKCEGGITCMCLLFL